MRRFPVAVLVAALAGGLAASPADRDQYFDVGGHRLRARIAGAGSPAIVFENGIGDTLTSWRDVYPEAARLAQAVAYDRAGVGRSDPGPEPRSYEQVAGELHVLLERARIPAPYVLVGHSLGGAEIRAFAARYPTEVAGLVFVDPFSEHVFDGLTTDEMTAGAKQQADLLANGPAGPLAELVFGTADAREGFPRLRAFGPPPPTVPMTVLIAGRDRPPHWRERLIEQWGPWVNASIDGNLAVLAGSGHYLQADEPAMVIDAIRRAVFFAFQHDLERVLRDRGIDAALERYGQIRRRYPPDRRHERMINALGYQRLREHQGADAIRLFRLNVELFPDSSNAYDSLGEAYAAAGQRQSAIANYRKSLALDPGNGNAVEMLKKLTRAPSTSPLIAQEPPRSR